MGICIHLSRINVQIIYTSPNCVYMRLNKFFAVNKILQNFQQQRNKTILPLLFVYRYLVQYLTCLANYPNQHILLSPLSKINPYKPKQKVINPAYRHPRTRMT